MRRRTWGGARPGAGRPRVRIGGAPHRARPALPRGRAVHVVARVVPAIRLERAKARGALARALATSRARHDFRIERLGVGASRLELIAIADDRVALARGMQGFQVAAARYLNASARRRGTVFPDRYVARALTTRRALDSAIAALPPVLR